MYVLKIRIFLTFGFVLSSLSAQAEYQVKSNLNTDPVKVLNGSDAYPSYNDGETPMLVYHSPDVHKNEKQTYAITAAEWTNARRKEKTRSDLFIKLYWANVRAKSTNNQRHVGCFTGKASDVIKNFFTSENKIANVEELYLSANSDQSVIGVEFNYLGQKSAKVNKAFHFRLPHCYQGGKAPLITQEAVRTAKMEYIEDDRAVAQAEPTPAKNIQEPAKENCFQSYDVLDPLDRVTYKKNKLPYFTLRADYDKIKTNSQSRPWKGMSIADEAGAKKVADVVLDHFYDSMIQNTKKADQNFIAQKTPATKSQWCHMPWLNVGESGREAIHGLTKERDLEPSSMYPTAGLTPETKGAGWGIGYYNDISCGTIGSIFGTPENPIENPQFVNMQFPDGTASIKVLFTSATLPELEKSFGLTANVSMPEQANRRLRTVKMIQIDVAIKDSSVVGTRPEADHWFMISYYFDTNYSYASKHKFKGDFAALLKMRPIGVQTGFTIADSVIFKDSKTNSVGNSLYPEANRLLNGPADNSKASCLSCHGAAGTMLRMVPGVKDFTQYTKIKTSTLDFSQQLALAKKNYETRSGQLKSISFK